MLGRSNVLAALIFLADVLTGHGQAQVASFTCPMPAPQAACGNPEFQSCSMDVPDSTGSSVTRHFCIHVPDIPESGLGTVWGFHGGGGNGKVMTRFLADQTEQGAVLVAPTAERSSADCARRWRSLGPPYRASWADLSNPADPCPQAQTPDNDADLDFVTALMNEIDQQLDAAGHWALGFSSGAGMIYQLMITNPLSQRFAGFAPIANAMTEAKLAAAAGGGAGGWSAELEIAHPILVMQGTADRLFVPLERIGEAVDQLFATGQCQPSTPPRPSDGIRCWGSFPMIPGRPKHYYEDRGLQTRLWLMQRNRPLPRAIEGVYPDRGHGRDTSLNQEDATVTVRREWPASRRPGSQPIVWLTSIDAAHTMAGPGGAYPPCRGNCDIDIIREILQFWRANAGLRTPWR